MANDYKIRHVFNILVKGGKGKSSKGMRLARVAIIQDHRRDFHVMMICPEDHVGQIKDPVAYLMSSLSGAARGG